MIVRQLLFIFAIMFLIVSCTENSTYTAGNSDTTVVEGNGQKEAVTSNVYKSDSVIIDVKSDSAHYIIALTVGGKHREYDLSELNIPLKTPGEIRWRNKEFACMMTWYSQAQSRCVFIPTNNVNEFIYIDKDIEETDSINSNIVYIDSVSNITNKVVFTVENLVTGKSKSVELSIHEENSVYPYYDEMELTGNKLVITTTTEKKSIDLTEINNGL